MKKIIEFIIKRFLLLSIIFNLIIVCAFIISAASSKQEIPASLLDVYGDTSGIHDLTITGTVSNMQNHFSYDFEIKKNKSFINTHVYNSAEDVTMAYQSSSYYQFISSFPPVFTANYIPIEPYKTELIENINNYSFNNLNNNSSNSFDNSSNYSNSSSSDNSSSNSDIRYLKTYKIHADTFEVFPCWDTAGFSIKLEPENGKLYYKPSSKDNSYIYFGENGDRYFGEHIIGNGYVYMPVYDDTGTLLYQTYYQETGFSNTRTSRLPCKITIDDTIFIVPVGKNYFGHTAVYRIETPGGIMPGWQDSQENTPLIIADELYPIELEYDKDEILGMIEIKDAILLSIRRGEDFELIRINLKTREAITVTAKDVPYFVECYYLSDNSIVFFSSRQGYQCPDVWAFDLSGEGLKHTASIKAVTLWEEEENYYKQHYISDAIWKEDRLYIAEYTLTGEFTNDMAHISSFDSEGTLIGRCKVLCGAEEDYPILYSYSLETAYMRLFQNLSIE